MDKALSGQVTRSAADIYEDFFLPALFSEWAGRVSDAAQMAPGQKILDVACGTGALACEAARRIEPGGTVAGLDRNDGMLAVARRKAPGIDWRLGRAEALPFADESFDAVVSQFGLMFFEDRDAALKEMWRALRPGGMLTVAVWDTLEHTPGYAAMVALLQRLFGDRIANELRAPFILGDVEVLRSLFAQAGIIGVDISTHVGAARFLSIESWVRTDVKGWTLADLIDDTQYRLLLREAETALQPYTLADGAVAFDAPAHIVTTRKD
ncbi:MAG: methyltransferase domain-containing protein [Betaproteobacteria bacterium]|nr:methyltransferase domain-containing protein [Betaproteobacteria bacterium]